MRERKAEMSYGKCQLDSHTTLSAGLPPSWSTAPVAGRLFDGIYYGKYQSSKLIECHEKLSTVKLSAIQIVINLCRIKAANG